jgi:8-oxo-dGTP pyrophosphatase MutT (NUDIX family)
MIYESSEFHDDEQRAPKFARLIGSMIAIYLHDKFQETIMCYPDFSRSNHSDILVACIYNGVKIARVGIDEQITQTLRQAVHHPKSLSKREFIDLVSNYVQKLADHVYSQLQRTPMNISALDNENIDPIDLNPNLKQAVVDYCSFFKVNPTEFSLVTDLLNVNENLQDRSNMKAHLATQAFLFNTDFTQVLLLEHKSLGIWIQPGGHIDMTDTSLREAAFRELTEETGLLNSKYMPIDEHNPEMPIQIQLNNIPARPEKNEGDHVHVDLAYVFINNDISILNIDENESTGAQWISFSEFADNPRFAVIAKRIKQYIISA